MNFKKSLSIICSLMLNYAYAADVTTVTKEELDNPNKTDFHAALLFLKPNSNNLDYAYFVSGLQPYNQSWHSQMINPDYSPAFELGLTYALPQSLFNVSIDWMHINTSDSAFKQASNVVNLATLEFVAPPFEMSPPVFGVKRADSTAKFNFDNVELNVGRVFEPSSNLHAKFFGGLNVLRINQTISTKFSDFAGALPTPYSYALPADPSFSMELQSGSKYMGAGPDLGLNVEYNVWHGIGIMGQALGTVTAGTTSTEENFTGTSASLTSSGRGTSRQSITTPEKVQVVPGFDGKLGVFYHYSGKKISNFTIEGGYRMVSYLNAITTIAPGTLVQAGTVTSTPVFATGTMAIVSIVKKDSPFNLNGPYVNLKVGLD